MTSVSAVFWMLPEMAATGRATIKNAVPITVATKQPGRTKRHIGDGRNGIIVGGTTHIDVAQTDDEGTNKDQ